MTTHDAHSLRRIGPVIDRQQDCLFAALFYIQYIVSWKSSSCLHSTCRSWKSNVSLVAKDWIDAWGQREIYLFNAYEVSWPLPLSQCCWKQGHLC
jgi:hypothetical protein